jgi:hypothetical protein
MMKSLSNALGRTCCIGLAVIPALVMCVDPSWAIVCAAPAPLIGITGPYGLLAAGVVYGGYLLFKRFRHPG